MGEVTNNQATQDIYQQIRELLIQARSRALQVVKTGMVVCYWQIGRLIVEEEQRGETRAVYGKGLIKELSRRLSAEFGRGFDKSNLWNMRDVFICLPKIDALRRELSRTHYRPGLLQPTGPKLRSDRFENGKPDTSGSWTNADVRELLSSRSYG